MKLDWRYSLFCDCDEGWIPKFGRTGYAEKVIYWEKIESECDFCHSKENQYMVITEEKNLGNAPFIKIFCNDCVYDYSCDYIGDPPKGKKYKDDHQIK